MKKNYVKSILREVRGSFSRFLAIFAIVALGAGFLAGLLATTPDMRHSVDQFYRDTNMMDLRVASPRRMWTRWLRRTGWAPSCRATAPTP